MEYRKSKVLANQTLGPGVCCLWVDAPYLASSANPGEFVMAICGEGSDPLLPRAISIHRYGPMVLANEPTEAHPEWVTPGSVALLFNAGGLARGWLGAREAGEEISILGPLGHGYAIDPAARRLLMAGGGTGLAPLIALADEAGVSGLSVTIISAGRTASLLYPREWVPPQVRLVEVTEDGSAGQKGLITDIMPGYMEEADQMFLCGPVPMYKAVRSAMMQLGVEVPTQVLLEVRMACGFGICYGCSIPTEDGMKLVCRDGPRFDLDEVDWGRL
ncbi:MAG: dihydroorotate dehydrogenase electron transfer subunit [Dehalococcoidia bacterium]